MKYIADSVGVIAKVLSVIVGEGYDDRWDDVTKNYPNLKWYIW